MTELYHNNSLQFSFESLAQTRWQHLPHSLFCQETKTLTHQNIIEQFYQEMMEMMLDIWQLTCQTQTVDWLLTPLLSIFRGTPSIIIFMEYCLNSLMKKGIRSKLLYLF